MREKEDKKGEVGLQQDEDTSVVAKQEEIAGSQEEVGEDEDEYEEDEEEDDVIPSILDLLEIRTQQIMIRRERSLGNHHFHHLHCHLLPLAFFQLFHLDCNNQFCLLNKKGWFRAIRQDHRKFQRRNHKSSRISQLNKSLCKILSCPSVASNPKRRLKTPRIEDSHGWLHAQPHGDSDSISPLHMPLLFE
ncbi:hypothetical protein SLE2022_355060 [Rubroshorea leprosula]